MPASPLAQGMLAGNFRTGRTPTAHGARFAFAHYRDERRLDAVERFLPLADKAGMSLVHLAMAFAISHPGVTSAIIGPRTSEQLDDLLAGAGIVLDDAILDEIDAIVPPGADVGRLDMAYQPPEMTDPAVRRRSPA